MRPLLTALLGVLLSTPVLAQPAELAAMRADRAAMRPRAFADKWFGCEERTSRGFEAMATGDRDTVDFAMREVRPLLDACPSELLGDAMGRALVRNPLAVLPYVRDEATASRYCVPFLSGEAPAAETRAALRRSSAALDEVRDAALAPAVARCRAVIRAAMPR